MSDPSRVQKMTVEEAAARLKVSGNTIRRRITRGKLPAEKVDGRLLVSVSLDPSASYEEVDDVPAVDVNRLMRERDDALRTADSEKARREAQVETMNHLLPQMVRNIVEQMIPVLQTAVQPVSTPKPM